MGLPAGWRALDGRKEISSGQATVYPVTRTGDSATYALKRLNNPKRSGRFKREVETMSGLAEAGLPVPPIVARDLEVEKPWFVMPWFERGHLISARNADGTVDHLETLRRLIELANAIQGIHAAGLAHRDLKPENILLSDSGDVLISDFGLCMEVGDDRLTETTEGVGSRFYIAPENEAGIHEEEDQRPADFYAFAKICWCLLTGQPPRPREQQLEPGKRLADLIGPQGWTGLDNLSAQLLLPDPRARVQEWAVVIDELNGLVSLLGGKPKPARDTHGGLLDEIQLAIHSVESSERSRKARLARERSEIEQRHWQQLTADLSEAFHDQFDGWIEALDASSVEIGFAASSGGATLGEILVIPGLEVARVKDIPEFCIQYRSPALIAVNRADGLFSCPLYVAFYGVVAEGDALIFRTLSLNDDSSRTWVNVIESPAYPAVSESVRAGGTRQRILGQEFMLRSRPIVERTVLAYLSSLNSVDNCAELQAALIAGLAR